jgi:hypothetical protein
MHAYRAFLASVLILLGASSSGAVENIKTPFQLVPLWSEEKISHPEQGQIFSLTKKVKARLQGAPRTVTLDEGEYVVLNVHERMLEVRKEKPFDRPCSETEPIRGRRLQTYLVDLAEVYDADLHLRLRLAYPKGC